MEAKFAQMIVEAAEGGEEELHLDKHYSGRGMMGRQTAGVSGSLRIFVQAVATVARMLAQDEEDAGEESLEFEQEMGQLSYDNMGRDLIFY